MDRGHPHPPERARRAAALWWAWSVAIVVGAGAAFYVPALRRTGVWPAPLDDVYIHFDFARSIAEGHPFEWMPGNGYSSGATSIVYPFVLAIGYFVGFRGVWLGAFAAGLAIACVVDLARSLRELARGAPRWVTFLFAPMVCAVPLVDWSLFSGMEVALFAAVLGRALVSVRRAEEALPHLRGRAQIRAGVWLAMLVAVRPEAAALSFPLAVTVGRGGGSLSGIGSISRAGAPTVILLAAQAIANRALTGEWSAAGAVRKLLFANPYITRLDVAVGVLKNLIALRTTAFDAALGGWPFSMVLPVLAGVAMIDRSSRRLAIPLGIGAIGAILMVALNTTAMFQNWRYAVPSILMLLAAAGLGVIATAKRRGAIAGFGAALAGIACVAPFRGFGRQIDHFARASANIREQQAEVGIRLAAMRPAPRRVFLSDAGAIPYFSRLPALDGLGLGGYRDLPFARASVHGVPAVAELIERMPLADRPDVMAVYPSWWRGLADVFGTRFDSVTITDNVICGDVEKVLFTADFSALAPPDDVRPSAIDAVDVADLVEERAHDYVVPAPRGGWIVAAILALPDGTKRFDAGRIVPQGMDERFRIANEVTPGRATLRLRTDGGPPQRIRITIEREKKAIASTEVDVAERPADRWTEIGVDLGDVRGGDTIAIASEIGAFRDFHVWLTR
ncbi:MAG: hypothetical protein U0441_27890 [Polyangiaceae bacterium]